MKVYKESIKRWMKVYKESLKRWMKVYKESIKKSKDECKNEWVVECFFCTESNTSTQRIIEKIFCRLDLFFTQFKAGIYKF